MHPIEEWQSNHRCEYGEPIRLDARPQCRYTPHYHFDALNAEFFVEAFAKGSCGGDQQCQHWLSVWIAVRPIAERVLSTGMFVKYKTGTGLIESTTLHAQTSLPTKDHLQRSKVTFICQRMGSQLLSDIAIIPIQVAFFIDVESASGHIVRLWQSRKGHNYSLSEIFSLPAEQTHLSYGDVDFAHPDSIIFDQKKSCLT